MRRLPGSAAIVGLALALALATSACSGSFGMPSGANREGREIFDLWQTMFLVSVVVAAIVYGLMA